MTVNMSPLGLSVLVVDDESLARSRLRTLLGDCQAPKVGRIVEAAQAVAAAEALQREPFDVILLDIHMPGMDGLGFAEHVRSLPNPTALVFVTAHAEHAVKAFELAATDYLTKPVRLERLQMALQKVEQTLKQRQAPGTDLTPNSLLIQDRGRTERLPLDEVLYVKAELKYLTVQTATRSYLLEGSLNELELRFGTRFIRVHRNALVANHAMRVLEKPLQRNPGEETWVLRLYGLDDEIAVSRRQLPAVRAVIAGHN